MKRLLRSRPSLAQILPYVLAVGSLLGFASSFILSLDEYQLAHQGSFNIDCNLNPVISCGSVMESAASAVFGFPNSWIGLATFAAVGTVGLALLAGATFKRWFWLGLLGGLGAGLAFALWLLFESIYHIQALCPFCLTVDAVLMTIFWYVLLYVLGREYQLLPAWLKKPTAFARKYHFETLISIFLIIVAIILQHFWYYYGQFV